MEMEAVFFGFFVLCALILISLFWIRYVHRIDERVSQQAEIIRLLNLLHADLMPVKRDEPKNKL